MTGRRLTPRETLDRAILEKEWQQTVVDYAKLRGWLAFHARDSRGNPGPGFPDWVFARDGGIVIAELKTEKGQPTVEQYEWLYNMAHLDLLLSSGVFLWRPSDWDEVCGVLE